MSTVKTDSISIHEVKPLAPALFAILGAVFFWGGSFSAMKTALNVLDPWTVMWFRMSIAVVALLPFLPRLLPRRIPRADWKYLLPMALFQPCIYFLLESYAITYTTSSQAGVISASVPLMTLIGAHLTLGERMTPRIVGGILLSILGVAALTLGAESNQTAPNPLLGNLLEVAAMAAAAAYMLIVKKLSNRYNPWTLTAIQTLVGLLFFTPGLFSPTLPRILDAPEVLVPALLFLGVFVTLGAFGLYNFGLSRMPAGKASAFINLVPVVAVVLGYVFLGESLSLLQIIGAGTVIAGVSIGNATRKASRTAGNTL